MTSAQVFDHNLLRELVREEITALLTYLGLDVLPLNEREEALEQLIDAVASEGLGTLLEKSDPEIADAFLAQATAARERGDEQALLRALERYYPDFAEVFAQVAVRLVQEGNELAERWIEEMGLGWLFDPALDAAVAKTSERSQSDDAKTPFP